MDTSTNLMPLGGGCIMKWESCIPPRGPILANLLQYATRTHRLQSLQFQKGELSHIPFRGKWCSIAHHSSTLIQVTGISTLSCPPLPDDTDSIEPVHNIPPIPWKNKPSLVKVTIDGLQQLRGIHRIPRLVQALRQGTLIAVSDGSYRDGIGTSAFILHDGIPSEALWGVNAVPGSTQSQSAYHSELAGVMGSITIIWALCKIGKIQEGSTMIALDGQQAMMHASSDHPLPCHSRSFDLLRAIHRTRKKLPVVLHWQWVWGHQDSLQPVSRLDVYSQTNIIADQQAKQYLQTLLWQQYQPSIQTLSTGWQIFLNKCPMEQFDHDTIYNHAWSHRSNQYWVDKFDWHEESLDFVDWHALGKAMKQLPFYKQRHIMKQATAHLPIGWQLHRRNAAISNLCQLCKEQEETTTHLLWCQSAPVVQQWQACVQEFETQLTVLSTDPQLIKMDTTSPSVAPRHRSRTMQNDKFHKSSRCHQRANWYRLGGSLHGFVSAKWQLTQDHYQQQLQDKYAHNKRWTVELICKLMQISWDMWNQRNDIIHASDSNQLEYLNRQIRFQFHMGSESLSQPWWLTDSTVEQSLQWPVNTKRQWLESVTLSRSAYHNCLQRRQQEGRAKQQFLQRWHRTGSGVARATPQSDPP